MKVGDLVRPRPDGKRNIYFDVGVVTLEVWDRRWRYPQSRSRIFRVQWAQDCEYLRKQWWREDDLELISESQ